MKLLSNLLLLFLFASLIQETRAQTKHSPGSLADVNFIEGSWEAISNDKSIEAIWSAPVGDNIVGFVRMMKDGKATLYELFAFEQTPNGLMVSVKHFLPNLIGIEDKDESDRYHFLEAGDGWAVFEKQGEDVRVLYEKRSDHEFAIAIGKPHEGKWKFEDFWQFSKAL